MKTNFTLNAKRPGSSAPLPSPHTIICFWHMLGAKSPYMAHLKLNTLQQCKTISNTKIHVSKNICMYRVLKTNRQFMCK